ncbi:Oidioi.mRNA.OKI2018_I69.chr1.g491.t1.cds [Oikopleura dioica]|uniref:Amino acid transporter n=1 Tax=Oikopleura dioica TaxID=34765 RepID=A0ABN7SQ18_OIKDI|nr:Oidioi.mRNA.OKI2018_I69.chr1.g491.t1.cds [Oikopleura dioica]
MTISGVILGICLGFGLKAVEPPFDKVDIEYIKFPGTMLLQALKMCVLPLIVFSIISGIASLDSKTTGKMGGIAVAYYGTTTLLAVIEGIILCAAIRPGVTPGSSSGEVVSTSGDLATVDTLLDLIRNLLPTNIVMATFSQSSTYRKRTITTHDCRGLSPGLLGTIFDEDSYDINCITTTKAFSLTKDNVNDPDYGYNSTLCSYVQTKEEFINSEMQYECEWKGIGTNYSHTGGGPRENVLGVLFFSISLALAITRIPDKRIREVLVAFFNAMNDAILRVVFVIIWYAPIGIIFLIAPIVMSDDFNEVGLSLLRYSGTVIGGLALHSLIILPIVFILGTKDFTLRAPLNVIKYVKGVSQALLTAFATGSSSATLPLTMSTLEINNDMDQRITRFVLPIGATINMDGTALYEAVAAIYIAQAEGLPLSFGDYILISITATVASIGAAGIPQAGLVTMIIVLTAIGLPPDRVSLILAVDPILDRFRTAINVMGDAMGCGVVRANVSLDEIEQAGVQNDALEEPASPPRKKNQVASEL